MLIHGWNEEFERGFFLEYFSGSEEELKKAIAIIGRRSGYVMMGSNNVDNDIDAGETKFKTLAEIQANEKTYVPNDSGDYHYKITYFPIDVDMEDTIDTQDMRDWLEEEERFTSFADILRYVLDIKPKNYTVVKYYNNGKIGVMLPNGREIQTKLHSLS